MTEPPAASDHVAPEGSVTWFFAQLRDGDDLALAALWRRFFPRLVGLAAHMLAQRPQRAAAAEDAAQDALISFWRRARAGEFADVVNREHLWRLLAQFTVYKARRQARHEAADIRGGGRVLDEGALAAAAVPQRLEDLAGDPPAVDVDVQAAELLELLPEDLRQFAVLRLLGHSTHEIADLLDCTQRKVQRKLDLVRMKWERQLRAD